MPTAEETRIAIRSAMKLYGERVLDERRLDPATGIYAYDFEITKTEVYKLAGGVSRSTLKASYHDGLRGELDTFIDTLKRKTGRGQVGKAAAAKAAGKTSAGPKMDRSATRKARAASTAAQVELLAAKLTGMTYRVIELEREIDQLRKGVKRNVVELPSATRRRG